MGGELLGSAGGFGVEGTHLHRLGALAVGAVVAAPAAAAVALAEADDGQQDGQGQRDGDAGHQDEHQLVALRAFCHCKRSVIGLIE